MKARMHHFILHNDDIREASDKLLSPGQVGLLSGWGVFSTIKVIDGVLFAFERHWARMTRDAALMRVPLPADPARVENNLLRLVERNGAQFSTMRLVVVRNRGGMWEGPDQTRPSDLIAFTAESHDWGDAVKLDYVRQARHAAGNANGLVGEAGVALLQHGWRCRRRSFFTVIDNDGLTLWRVNKHEAAAANIAGCGPRHCLGESRRHSSVDIVAPLLQNPQANVRRRR